MSDLRPIVCPHCGGGGCEPWRGRPWVKQCPGGRGIYKFTSATCTKCGGTGRASWPGQAGQGTARQGKARHDNVGCAEKRNVETGE